MSQTTMKPLDLCDHLNVSRQITEGIFLAVHGLADNDERDALAAGCDGTAARVRAGMLMVAAWLALEASAGRVAA